MGLHVGVVGGGGVGRVHLDALAAHPAVSNLSLADADPAILGATSEGMALTRTELDYRRLLDDPAIDVIDICLPHDLHYSVGMAAFDAGKHVLSEKPIALTVEEADGLIAAAERSGRRYFVALNQRFLPAHEAVKQMLAEGEIGDPLMVIITIVGNELTRMAQPEHWKGTWARAGGGVLADTGTHVVDLMLWWFGMPDRVTCSWKQIALHDEAKGDDTAILGMTYANGPLASLAMTYAASDTWSETKRVYGSAGSLHVSSEDIRPLTVIRNGEPVVIKVEHDANWWPFSVQRGVAHFIDCLVEDREFTVTPTDARQTLQVILDAYRSAVS